MALAFIFDLDGVIVDSNPVHEQVWHRYLLSLGIPASGKLAARMYGRRNDEIVRDLFGQDLSPEAVFFHGAAKEALYRESMKEQLQERLVPGVREFLEANKGIPKGLATNAEPANAEFILTESGLKSYFSVVVDGHQVERPKPDPEVFLRAASLLGVQPRDCVVFEDSLAGVQAALAAGARVVALATTHHSLPQADLVVRDFLAPELQPWLTRQTTSL
ncbi:MAG: HAD family hydrolase [Bryobacteraceae bacterium]